MKTPSERLENSLTKDNLWLYILSLLRKGEMYPYEIRKEIKREFGFRPGNVTAYIVLRKLLSGGFVEKGRKEKEKGPERGYYRITRKGKEELAKGKRIYKEMAERF